MSLESAAFDWDSCQSFAGVPAKYAFADCNSMNYLSCATCCEFDVIIATESIAIVASSSCREARAFRKAMNGCELRTDDVGAS